MTDIDFALDRPFVALHQLLKLTGIADSGGAGKALVAAGGVRVDGVDESRKARKLSGGECVEVGDVRIHVRAVA